MKIKTYQEVESHLRKERRKTSLLMGNGFSAAFDTSIFTYTALAKFLESKSDPLINKLFDTIKTKNFELIMQQLETSNLLLQAFDADSKVIDEIKKASIHLKQGLIKSIQEMHPGHVFKIEEETGSCCANFLRFFMESGGEIFTTNYDLLLYWVLIRNGLEKHIDGFGEELLNPNYAKDGEEPEYSDLIWGPYKEIQNVHYLHGALHLFNNKSSITKEKYDPQNYLLEKIKQRISEDNYPIFVTAGNGEEKLEHIRSNRYLNFCYEKLCKTDGSLVSFGFNFGNYDEHIIDAINRAFCQNKKASPKLRSIYIGTYSEEDVDHINYIAHKFAPKLAIFDAKTAPVWKNTIPELMTTHEN